MGHSYPFVVLGIGLATVLGLILALRVHAFVALIASAMLVSLLAPGPIEEKIKRVAEAFGSTAGSIGVVIALAAIVGNCLMHSGGADRIVRSFLRVLGEKRAATALCASGFVLAIPVFFDTVFYLLVPLARSLWLRTRKNYVLYVTAIGAGGAITHTLVPPTPGPLFMAERLGIDMGVMIVVGTAIGLPMAVAGLATCRLMNRLMDLPMRPLGGQPDPEPLQDHELPPLWLALLPVLLPVALISANTLTGLWAHAGDSAWLGPVLRVAAVLGNANLALLISAVIAMGTVMAKRGLKLRQLAALTEDALSSAGVIILITAAGGAFGAMLREAGIKDAVQAVFPGGQLPPFLTLLAAFAVAAVLKTAQGSSTVAIMTTASMFAAMGATSGSLGYHVVYLATTIACGSLVGSWMNDSGFWIFAKMGGLTETESLRTWTPLLIVLAVTGLGASLLGAWLVPLV